MKFLKHSSFSVFLAALLTTSSLAIWIARPAIKVFLSGTVERDREAVQLDKAGLLNPGEVLHWTIRSQNEGSAAAHHYQTIGEIPANTSYVVGSAMAEGNATILFSIDQGKTYSAKPMIEQKQPDGSVRQVPAPAALYTHIRYEWSDPLSAGKQISAFYRVRVR